MNFREQAELKRIERRTMHLGSLRSVSAAFKATVKEEPLYVPRQRTQEVTRHPAQASDPGGDGGLAQGGNTNTYISAHPGHIQHPRLNGGGTGIDTIEAVGGSSLGYNKPADPIAERKAFDAIVKPQPKIIQAGEIIAWRAWIARGSLLRSVSMDTHWSPGVPMTASAMGIANAMLASGAGVHAFKTRQQAESHFSPLMYIIGEVELWGEVIEHQDGYRAQYGAVRSLLAGPSPSELHALQRRYGVVAAQMPTPLATPAGTGAPVLLGTITAAILLAFVFLLTNAYVKGPPTATSYYNGSYYAVK